MVDEILKIKNKIQISEEIKKYDGILFHIKEGTVRTIGVNKDCGVRIISVTLYFEYYNFVCEFCNEEKIPFITCLESTIFSVYNFNPCFSFNYKKYPMFEVESLTKITSIFISLLNKENCSEYFKGEVPVF